MKFSAKDPQQLKGGPGYNEFGNHSSRILCLSFSINETLSTM